MPRQEMPTTEFDNFLIQCPAGKSDEVMTIGEARQREDISDFVVGAIARTEKFMSRATSEEEMKEAIEDGFAGAILKDDEGEFHIVPEGEDATSYLERVDQSEPVLAESKKK